MENENLFKEIQAYPELNFPLNFSQSSIMILKNIIQNTEMLKNLKFSHQYFLDLKKIQTIQVFYQVNWFEKDNLKSNGKNLSIKLSKDLLNSKLRSEMINEFIQNHDQHAYLLSLVEVDNFDLNSYKINDANKQQADSATSPTVEEAD